MNLSSSVPTSVRGKNKVSVDQGKSVSTKTRTIEKRVVKQNSLRCELLKDQASTLCREGKYLQAASILEKLIQQEDIGTLVLFAEVSIQLGRKQDAKKAIDDVVRLSVTSPSDVDDVFCRASDLVVNNSYLRAIVLLRILSGMLMVHPSLSHDDIVKGIRKCVCKMQNAVEPMIKSGDKLKFTALDYGLPYMVEMVDDLRRVENSDPISTTLLEACCVYSIGHNYNLADEHEKSIEFSKSGLDVMKRQFGNNASKYYIYGALLHNLGIANNEVDRYSIAEDYYNKAIDAFKNATDCYNQDDKQECIEVMQNELKILLKNMK